MERIKTLETRSLCESAKHVDAANARHLASLLAKQAAV